MTERDTPAAFSGANDYVLDAELASIVNISMSLEMPLLLKGELSAPKRNRRVTELLQRLEEKGYVARDTDLPVHLFRATVSREEYGSSQLESLAAGLGDSDDAATMKRKAALSETLGEIAARMR